MNNKNKKRALLTSLLSLTISGSMLVGTTFAWFTDSAYSENNVITAGNLDAKMYYSSDNDEWTEVTETAAPVFSYENWEPGYSDVKYIKIENAGSLAFKYSLKISPSADMGILADVIDVYYMEVTDDFIAPTNFSDFPENARIGTFFELIADPDGAAHGALLPKGATVANEYEREGAVTACIALHMQESAGNEYQGLNKDVTFALKLVAAQWTYESDSFNDQYDKDPISGVTIDGITVDIAEDGLYYNVNDEADKTAYILDSDSWSAFSAAVNADENYFRGKTAKLLKDVDLSQTDIPKIANFAGTFDGNGKALTVKIGKANENTALFNGLTRYGAIKNLVVNGTFTLTESDDSSVPISGGERNDYVGIVGINNGAIENCVNNAKVSVVHMNNVGYYKTINIYAGGIAGGNYGGTIKNCQNNGVVDVELSYATQTSPIAQMNVGGITGKSDRNIIGGYKGLIENCVNTANVTGNGVYYARVGGIVGWNRNTTVRSCSNSGVITAKDGRWGGQPIAGLNQGTIE